MRDQATVAAEVRAASSHLGVAVATALVIVCAAPARADDGRSAS